jgi:pSer/pThr/pTyr-binding forkhead associated (FHA) protein
VLGGLESRAARNEEVIMRAESEGAPHLVVLAPESDRGRRIPLTKDYLVVGRERTCDVRFGDPCVSRAHAALRRRGNTVYVEDLGSSAGTFVNGETAVPARELHTGDVLTFANVEARLEPGGSGGDQTMTVPARPAGAGMVHHVGNQDADYIHYDERQYYWHVQNVNQQRENFLREVAATKTKARWLAWTGFLLFVVGFGIFAAADLNFIKSISDSIQNGYSAPPTTSPLGREVGGIPIGLAGWALAAVGMLLLIVGIVLHVVATSRRKQAYREFPVLPPWPGAQPMRRG